MGCFNLKTSEKYSNNERHHNSLCSWCSWFLSCSSHRLLISLHPLLLIYLSSLLFLSCWGRGFFFYALSLFSPHSWILRNKAQSPLIESLIKSLRYKLQPFLSSPFHISIFFRFIPFCGGNIREGCGSSLSTSTIIFPTVQGEKYKVTSFPWKLPVFRREISFTIRIWHLYHLNHLELHEERLTTH